MNKKNKNGRLIVIMGAIAIIIVTVCAFNKNTLRYKYYEYSIEKKYNVLLADDIKRGFDLQKSSLLRLTKNTLLPLLTSIMSMITLTM